MVLVGESFVTNNFISTDSAMYIVIYMLLLFQTFLMFLKILFLQTLTYNVRFAK